MIPKLFPQSDLIVVRAPSTYTRRRRSVTLTHARPPPPCPGSHVHALIPRALSCAELVPQITHKRPIGLVAVPDTDGRIRVAELMEGSWSAQAAALARLSQAGALTAAAPGDVLRAYTFTVFEFQARWEPRRHAQRPARCLQQSETRNTITKIEWHRVFTRHLLFPGRLFSGTLAGRNAQFPSLEQTVRLTAPACTGGGASRNLVACQVVE